MQPYINSNINDLYDYMISKTHEDKDMILSYSHQDAYNIGVLLIKCCENTLLFFEEILETMTNKINQSIDTHDQSEVIEALRQNKLNVSKFENNRIWVSDYIYPPIIHEFYIFKITVDLHSSITRHNQRLSVLQRLQFITEEDYNKYKE